MGQHHRVKTRILRGCHAPRNSNSNSNSNSRKASSPDHAVGLRGTRSYDKILQHQHGHGHGHGHGGSLMLMRQTIASTARTVPYPKFKNRPETPSPKSKDQVQGPSPSPRPHFGVFPISPPPSSQQGVSECDPNQAGIRSSAGFVTFP